MYQFVWIVVLGLLLGTTRASARDASVYISTSYYDGVGIKSIERMRVEIASSFYDCKEQKMAQKIFVDSTNELREVWMMRKNGHWESGPAGKHPLRDEVDAVFSKGKRSSSPCVAASDHSASTSETPRVIAQ